MPVEYKPLEPISANENVLRSIGRKVGNGSELTLAENLIAMTATAEAIHSNYGPGPTEMVMKKPELPETVKGVLAQYVG